MLALLFDGLERGFQVARVVHRIEYAEHIDAVDRSALDKLFHHVIGIVAVAQQVLPTQQHLLAGVGHGFLQLTDALPRVFTQITDARIEGRPTPGLHGPEANLIELGRDGQHILQAHAGGQDGLVGVTQHHIGDSECLFYGSHADTPCRTGLTRAERGAGG